MRSAHFGGRLCRKRQQIQRLGSVDVRSETGVQTNTRNERWTRLHDRFQETSQIDASRRATFLDPEWDTGSELRNDVEALRESDKMPGWLQRAVDRAGGELKLRGGSRDSEAKTRAQSLPVAAVEIRLDE